MSDDVEPVRGVASPYSTGGGGVRFEHRVGAVLLGRMLAGEPTTELGERTPIRVAFQQYPATHADDIVATAGTAVGASIRVDIAVRRTPRFIRSDLPTTELIATLIRADLDAELTADPLEERRLAIAVSGRQQHSQEVAVLADIARGQPTAGEFVDLVRTPRKFAARLRLDHLIDMVGSALVSIGSDAASAQDRCWRLLRRLWVMQIDLEAGHEDDWTRLVGDLKAATVEESDDAAIALRDRIEQLAGELERTAGAVDAALLRRRLHGHIRPDAHVSPVGWTHLLELNSQAHATVERSLDAADSVKLTLPRAALRAELSSALRGADDLLVSGDSGVGKSALVMDNIETSGGTDDLQSVAINLRQLPATQLELIAYLSTPLEELFAELSAPLRLLVIDSAEAAAEGRSDVFAYLLSSARRAGVKVVAVAATEGAAVVRQLMGPPPQEFVVPGLDDDELKIVAGRLPVLARLFENVTARELLRRPIVVDLFARANDPGIPLSEAQALDHIWRHLVRNGERRDAGDPDAREQVMLRLGRHAVTKGDVDVLLERLDGAAVEGLRRSGLLAAASDLAWEPVPSFKHDLLRSYSVARILLIERDPARAVIEIEAQRWTLASARLACQTVLAAPDDPSDRAAGRFGRLQRGFDEIAAAGHGQRWSDVPTEALASIPDGAALLGDAWPTLLDNDAHGLRRLFRVLNSRHRRDGIIDPAAAGPVVRELVTTGVPPGLVDEAAELICDWLRVLALTGTLAGQATRVALRESIITCCAENERSLDAKAAARQAELDAHTPAAVAADEERKRRFGATASSRPSRRRRTPTRHRPYQWISDSQIEQLALLGHDLGADGEAVLRRIAEDEPHSLVHAVESDIAGLSLGAYSSNLLLDLVEAYYIIDDADSHDGRSGGIMDDGIRDHRFAGLSSRFSSITHGPFLSMFRADYRNGVVVLNRMLDHAARHRIRVLSRHRNGIGAETDQSEFVHLLSITGEPQDYIGDAQVWLWYRGTGVGPHPCMSALQALEFVTDEYVAHGVPSRVLTAIMLDGAHSLAMPALALGVLVRHLETAGESIDPFLREPTVWSLEFARANRSPRGGSNDQISELANSERRSWNLRDVATVLAFRSDGERLTQLKSVGEQLLTRAADDVGDDTSAGALEHIAAVRNWASSLDRDAYDITEEDDHLLIQQSVDPEVEAVLGPTNDDLRRTNDAMGLELRHAHTRDNGGRAPAMESDALTADIASARELVERPPRLVSFAVEGPVAVAATAVELHLSGQVIVANDDLVWCTELIARAAVEAAEGADHFYEHSIFSQGADRSAARALPFLLLPTAAALRASFEIYVAGDVDELIDVSRAASASSSNEVRLAYARALDVVWTTPCDTAHLHGRCHHSIAMGLVAETFHVAVLGPWDYDAQLRAPAKLDPPNATSFDALDGDDIYGSRLTPALRAIGSAATSTACCRHDAQLALRSLLSAHQRSMLAAEHGYHHSHSDALVAARAALSQAIDGRDDVVLDYVRTYVAHARELAEALQALAAAAEERPAAGQHANRLWPKIMDMVLDAVEGGTQVFDERTWGDYAEAALLPISAGEWGYLTLEQAGEPVQWRDLLSYKDQVERWLDLITPTRNSVDNLVIAIRELDVQDQLEYGLRWVERIVTAGDDVRDRTFTLPEWLRERRADLVTEEHFATWQRILDLLVVAGDSRVADLAD